MDRVVVLFLPFLIGLLWEDSSRFSIAWSLGGSILISALAQTQWFRQSRDELPVTQRLLRPVSMYHFYFLGFHVLGGTFYALDAGGYSFWGQVASPQENRLATIAAMQSLMLLGHASVTAGMKLVGFRYDRPKYVIPAIPPYSLIVASFVSFVAGTVTVMVPALSNLANKFFDISTTAILVELWFSLRRRRFTHMTITFCLFAFNLVQQILSGWKGPALWMMILVGALIYPLMPRRVLVGGLVFLIFWSLYLYPFGNKLRALVWYHQMDRNQAVAASLEYALDLTIEERLDNIWAFMNDRTTDLWQFEKYYHYVPGLRPYYGFGLAQEALIALVPRILWPEKPDLEALSMQRVYDAGVIVEGTPVSAKPNFYIDAYLSGGAMGIFIGCVLFGIWTMFISRTCERLFGGYEIGTCIVYTSLFTFWFNSAPTFLFFVGATWTSWLTMLGIFVLGVVMGWVVPESALSQSSQEPVRLVT